MEATPGGSFSYVKNGLNSTKLVMLEFLFYFLDMLRTLRLPYFNIFLFRDLFLTWIMESLRITVMDSRVKKWNKVSLCTVLGNEWVQFPLMRMFFLCHKIDACCWVWLWCHHHGRKMMEEHLVGYQGLATGHVAQRNGIDSAGHGSQALGSLALHPLALTPILTGVSMAGLFFNRENLFFKRLFLHGGAIVLVFWQASQGSSGCHHLPQVNALLQLVFAGL